MSSIQEKKANDGKRSGSWPKILAVSGVLLAALVLWLGSYNLGSGHPFFTFPPARAARKTAVGIRTGRFTVNLNDSSQRRYLKAGVVLATREKKLWPNWNSARHSCGI